METTGYFAAVVDELNGSAEAMNKNKGAYDAADQLASGLLEAGSVFVAGAGRSGLMGKAFAMRLMHTGVAAYVVGETITPGIQEGDWLVLGSGSGETASLVAMANKAKQAGAKVALITTKETSTLAEISDIAVVLPGVSKEQNGSERSSIQPMASLFEQSLLLFYDALVLKLMELKGLDSKKMYGNHANLE